MQPVVLPKENDNMEPVVSDKQKMIMSITESSSKIHKPATCKEATSNPIYGQQ